MLNPVLMGNQQGPPANSGPNVIRIDGTGFFLIAIDPITGDGAFFGADLFEVCSGGTGFDIFDTTIIFPPEDDNRVIELSRGKDLTASLWNPAPASCQDLNSGSATLIGTGKAHVVFNSNDELSFLNPKSVNHNAYGFNAQGWVENSDGEKLKVKAISRCVWDGIDANSLKCKNKVLVN